MRLSQYRARLQIRSRLTTAVENLICATSPGYRSYMRLRYGTNSAKECPLTVPRNTTLKSQQEAEDAIQQVRKLGLVPHPDPPKNWDALGAIGCILAHTDPSASILDAGGELYSPVLPSLSFYGYRNLVAVNLSFKRPFRRGPIGYRPGNLLRTPFEDNTFGAICCLSVIEHGVDLAEYVREMARLLKPGKILVTSTDYWCSPVETFGLSAYGVPICILGPQDIERAIALAGEVGLEPTRPIDMSCEEKVTRWQNNRLAFTFLTFTLRKVRKGSID